MRLKSSLIEIQRALFLRIFGVVLSFLSAVGVAFFFGTSAVADAFFFARRTIGSLTLLFEGIAELTLVPGLVKRARERGFRDVMTYTANIEMRCYVVFIPLCLLSIFYSDALVSVIAPGLSIEAANDASKFLSMMIVTVPIVVATSVSGAALASLHIFSLSVMIRLLPRIGLVVALFLVPLGLPMVGVVLGFVVGSFAMLAAFLIKRRRIVKEFADDATIPDTTKPLPTMTRSRTLAIGIISASYLLQTTLETYYASLAGVGAMVILVVGQRVSNIGMSEIMRSLLSVYYANFSRISLEKDPAALNEEIAKGLCTSAFYIFPLAAVLYAVAVPMASIILDFGAFDRSASILTGQFISIMAAVVAVRAVMGIFETALLATDNIPHVRIMLSVTVVTLLVRWIALEMSLAEHGILSIGISAFVASIVATVGYGFWLRRTSAFRIDPASGKRLIIVSTAAIASGFLTYHTFDFLHSDGGKILQTIHLGLAASLAAALYLSVTFLLRVPESDAMIGPVLRRLRNRTGNE